jgi:1,4-dihydroxy-2-naphthoyl-CoA synthase
VGIGQIKEQYSLNGGAIGGGHAMSVVGSLAVAASANSQETVDTFVKEAVSLKDEYWYSGYLGAVYLLAMSGNMWHREMMAD